MSPTRPSSYPFCTVDVLRKEDLRSAMRLLRKYEPVYTGLKEGTGWPQYILDAFEKKMVVAFAAHHNGQLAGLVFYTPDQSMAHIDLWLVRDEARGTGVYDALVYRCLKDAESRGCKGIGLTVMHGNPQAKKIYDSYLAKGLLMTSWDREQPPYGMSTNYMGEISAWLEHIGKKLKKRGVTPQAPGLQNG
jgi:ribosomal protein S18 acetylase RimI-like enzyme